MKNEIRKEVGGLKMELENLKEYISTINTPKLWLQQLNLKKYLN